MSLALANAEVFQYGSVTLAATGGVEPYEFSIVSGDGDLDPTTAEFDAPATSQVVQVLVTDADAATASATVTVHTVLTLLADIIAEYMDLDSTQVYLYDQKIDVPPDSRLYIAISADMPKPFSNIRHHEPDVNGDLVEVLATNFQLAVGINAVSTGKDARDRKEEVLLALNSTYSQQRQNQFGFYIAKTSRSFVNLSQIEGSAIPYRFNVGVNLQYQVSKTRVVQYYDTFTDSVVTDP